MAQEPASPSGSNSAKPSAQKTSANSAAALPFEPRSKKAPKKGKTPPTPKPATVKPQPRPKASGKNQSRPGLGVPEVVSRRMVARMAVCCGVPSLFGLLTFPLAYVIVTKELFELPNVAVVLVSMGCFGLGVLGLSYGVISASWEEDQPGSFLGISEFRLNWGRIVDSWQTRKQNS